jgi:hypothetical protein
MSTSKSSASVVTYSHRYSKRDFVISFFDTTITSDGYTLRTSFIPELVRHDMDLQSV